MKTCSKCHEEKPLSDFYLRKTGNRSGQYYEKCKTCMKLRGVNYYHTNHTRQLALAILRTKKSRKLKHDYIYKIKNVPCADCGKIYPPYVMDFDHRDRNDKIHEVARLTTDNWSLDKIKKEIAKCDIVCANCHRIRTFKKAQAELAKVVTAHV